jgi:hypothetical protein
MKAYGAAKASHFFVSLQVGCHGKMRVLNQVRMQVFAMGFLFAMSK